MTNLMLEYLTDEAYTFRSNPVYRAYEKVAKQGGKAATFSLLEALLVRQTDILDRPAMKTVDEVGKKE